MNINRRSFFKLSAAVGTSLALSNESNAIDYVFTNGLIFPSVTPESVGIPSRDVLTFLRFLRDRQVDLHSIMMIRHGKMAVEGYFAPYHSERKHRLYSVSKSFTSLAIGRMVTEGLLSLDERIIDHFPDLVGNDPHPWFSSVTVRHLLMMAGVHRGTPSGIRDKAWLPSWFSVAPSHPPGIISMYDTGCTNLLSALIERRTGKPFLEYLRPVFDELGVSEDIRCIRMPDGYSWGGSGVIATTLDMAKVAYLFMKEGAVNGKRLIDPRYAREAVSPMMTTLATNRDVERQQGYGYQIWRTRMNSFSFLGMGSQIATSIADKDFILAITADTQGTEPNMNDIISAFWNIVYLQLSDAPLQADKEGYEALNLFFKDAKILIVDGAHSSPTVSRINGRTYKMQPNRAGITEARFEINGGHGVFHYINERGAKNIPFGFGENIPGVFPETHYFGEQMGTPKNAGYEMYASGAWINENTLYIRVRLTDDYLGSLVINASFSGDELTLMFFADAEAIFYEYTGVAIGGLD